MDFAKFGPVERKDLSRIKKISGANLLGNAILISAVINYDDCDITDLAPFQVSTNKENDKTGVTSVRVQTFARSLLAPHSACKQNSGEQCRFGESVASADQ